MLSLFPFFCFLFSIPKIDYSVTRKIIEIRKSKRKTRWFSRNILFINVGVNVYLYIQNIPLELIFYRYFIELIIINLILKTFIFRVRPKYSFLNRGKFQSIYKMKIQKFDLWKKWQNQSFPSGHVSTVYLTWCLIPETWLLYNIYLLFVGLTVYARINVRAHHLSDCLFAILISHYFFYLNYSIHLD